MKVLWTLEKFPKFSEFMKSHTQQRTYYFQIKKCSISECPYHKTIRGPSHITPFPDPVPYTDDNNIQHYKEGTDESEKYLPSKLDDPSKRPHNIPFPPTAQASKNVGITVRCVECKKPRLLYAQKKIHLSEVSSLKRLLAGVEYVCGAVLSEYGGDDGNRDMAVLTKVFAR